MEDKKTWLTSKEVKSLSKFKDCELMHLRTEGGIKSLKKGNAYFYENVL